MFKDPWYQDGLQFTCTQCGNCCTGPPGYVWFNDDEAREIADYLKIDTQTFHQRYAHKINGRWSLNEQDTPHGYDCVFLKRDEQGKSLCGIYPVRPTQCRTWPFWPENINRPADWRRVAKNCPGIDHGKLYTLDQITITRDSNPSK